MHHNIEVYLTSETAGVILLVIYLIIVRMALFATFWFLEAVPEPAVVLATAA
jgi:hypothetical protein